MRFVVLIPQTRNDGSPVETQEIEEIFDRINTRFGGFTVEGDTDGWWTHGGQTFRDRCWKVSIVCGRERYFDARETVIEIGKQLGQLAMYFEVFHFDGVEIIAIEN